MRRLFLFFWAILLCGCASFTSAPQSAGRPAQPELAPFAMNGRIAVKYNGSRESAGLRWAHTGQSDEILLLTPLGQTAARVYSDSQRTTLDEGGKHYQNESPESLMQQVLGWYLPIRGLHHWVLGLADKGSPAQIERDGNGRVAVLRQDGWEVRYLGYDGDSSDSLPKRLQLHHEDLQVRLLIDEWQWDRQ